MTETSREGFVPAHLRGVDMDEYIHRRTKCQWHQIATDHVGEWDDEQGRRINKRCQLEVWDVSGIRLCRQHAMRIGTLNPNRYTLSKAREFLAYEEDNRIALLSRENARLYRVVEAQAQLLRRDDPEQTKRDTPTAGTIYFLRVGAYIKIGWTSDLAKRMRNGYHPDSQLLATKPGTRKDEHALHRKHAHLVTHGREWFPMAPQIMEEIEAAKRQHGEPPAVLFSAAKRTPRALGVAPDTRTGDYPIGKSTG